jgi:hypothetical protein
LQIFSLSLSLKKWKKEKRGGGSDDGGDGDE